MPLLPMNLIDPYCELVSAGALSNCITLVCFHMSDMKVQRKKITGLSHYHKNLNLPWLLSVISAAAAACTKHNI